jgi:hypothetical protein
MMRIDDVVADREVDALRLALELEVLDLVDGCLRNGVLLVRDPGAGSDWGQVCR